METTDGSQMASTGKQNTTMAKLARERKQAKEQARRQAAVAPALASSETPPPEPPPDVH
jgi:hypothetical protein